MIVQGQNGRKIEKNNRAIERIRARALTFLVTSSLTCFTLAVVSNKCDSLSASS